MITGTLLFATPKTVHMALFLLQALALLWVLAFLLKKRLEDRSGAAKVHRNIRIESFQRFRQTLGLPALYDARDLPYFDDAGLSDLFMSFSEEDRNHIMASLGAHESAAVSAALARHSEGLGSGPHPRDPGGPHVLHSETPINMLNDRIRHFVAQERISPSLSLKARKVVLITELIEKIRNSLAGSRWRAGISFLNTVGEGYAFASVPGAVKAVMFLQVFPPAARAELTGTLAPQEEEKLQALTPKSSDFPEEMAILAASDLLGTAPHRSLLLVPSSDMGPEAKKPLSEISQRLAREQCPITVEAGRALYRYIDEEGEDSFQAKVHELRQSLLEETGLLVPDARFVKSTEIGENEFLVSVYGEVSRGEIYPHLLMAVGTEEQVQGLKGIASTMRFYGLPTFWIEENHRRLAEQSGCFVFNAPSAFSITIDIRIKAQGGKLLRIQDLNLFLDLYRNTHCHLIEAVYPGRLCLGEIRDYMQELLAEGIPVRDLPTILDILGTSLSCGLPRGFVLERLRRGLASTLCERYRDREGWLYYFTLKPSTEEMLMRSLDGEGDSFRLEAEAAREICSSLTRERDKYLARGLSPILQVPPSLRRAVRGLLAAQSPDLPVLASDEVRRVLKIEHIASAARRKS
jgi:hypothetical protein